MNINSAEFIISSSDYRRCPDVSCPEYALIGRSNVGKSSLINMITGRSKLAVTSSTPGKTLLINHFLINGNWYLVDLPGYGYAKRDKRQQEQLKKLINGYIFGREQLTSLFVLVDSRLEPQKIDLEFMNSLGEHGVPFGIIFTKSDKLGRGKLTANIKAYLETLSEYWEELPPYFITSSFDCSGRDGLLDYIDSVNRSLGRT
mgnify:CR=1 FL=1